MVGKKFFVEVLRFNESQMISNTKKKESKTEKEKKKFTNHQNNINLT